MRPDQYFTDVIAKPIVRKSTNNRDIEITAEDEQQFLLRQQQYLQQGNPTGAGAGASPAGALAGSPNLPQSIQKDPNRKSVGSPGVQSSPRKVHIFWIHYSDGLGITRKTQDFLLQNSKGAVHK